ncbi:MAG: hypothetical protein BGO28_06665 [Alphaproteobacteria bacterium 43-37]|nr:MAG: hypothetical protein BGO28_06665 [Alphaproteobacteria bacterium 43-37]
MTKRSAGMTKRSAGMTKGGLVTLAKAGAHISPGSRICVREDKMRVAGRQKCVGRDAKGVLGVSKKKPPSPATYGGGFSLCKKGGLLN